MKIGVLTGNFHPDTGGPPTYLYHLLPMLRQRGHEVRVLTFGEAYSHDYGYPVTRISRSLPLPQRFITLTRAAVDLARWSEVLFVMNYVLPLPFIRLIYRRKIVAKIVSDYVWEYADRNQLVNLDVNAFQTAQLPPKLALIRAYFRFAVRLCDAIIAPSEHVGRLVHGWGVPPERIQIVYNAIPESRLHEIPRETLRRELGLPLDKILLVSIARLTPVKGVDVAIKALRLLSDDYHFVVVGEGDQLADLQAQSPTGRVQFVGRQEHEAALRYLRAGDIFVLSSHTEGLSHVLLEALSVGTPAVATWVGGNPEVLTNAINGLLIPPNDPPQLAYAMQRLGEDTALREHLAAGGRVRSADFSWGRTVEQTEHLLL